MKRLDSMIRRSSKYFLVVLVLGVSAVVVNAGSGSDVPNTFTTGDFINAGDFNDNFDYLEERVFDKSGGDLYYNDGNVGIGTNSPSDKLQVDGGNVLITGAGNRRLKVNSSDSTAQVIIDPGTVAGFAMRARPTGSFDIYDFENQTTRLRIISSGNVGIGTTSPSAKLDVVGDIKSNGQLVCLADGTNCPAAPAGDNLGNHTATLNINLDGNYLSGDGDSEGVFVDSSGNVGIGTNTPNNTIQIKDLINFDNAKESTMIGFQAGLLNSGDDNTFIGYEAGKANISGKANTFIGRAAGRAKTTGDRNTFIGQEAGLLNSGDENTFIGYEAGQNSTTGDENTFIDYQAGINIQTGSRNVFLGHQAGFNAVGSNQLYIDNSSTSSPLIYGDFNVDCVGIDTTCAGFKFEVNGSAAKPGGGSWSNSSDRRLKKNIQNISGELALNKITQLQGVTFNWVNPGEHSEGIRAGVIAQELEKVFPDWVEEVAAKGKDKELIPEGEKAKSISFPHDFNGYLIEAMKELKERNEALEGELQEMRLKMVQLESALEKLEILTAAK